MNDLEKTSNKLLDSIRKTKAGSDTAAVKTAKKKISMGSKATKSKITVAPKPKKAAMDGNKATPQKATKKKIKSPVASSNKASVKIAISVTNSIPFSDGSQVWPD